MSKKKETSKTARQKMRNMTKGITDTFLLLPAPHYQLFLCIAAGTGNRACFHFFTSSEDRFYSMLLWMVIEFQVGWNFGALARCAKWWHGFPDKIVID